MRLTLEFYNEQFHIKNEGRIIASILDEQEAMRVFAHILNVYLEINHSCPCCEDGREVETVWRESVYKFQDAIADYRKMYIDEPRTR